MGVPGLPDAPLTNRADRRLIPLRLLGWLSLAALALFLSLTAVELWAPRAAARLAGWGLLPGAVLRPARTVERPERARAQARAEAAVDFRRAVLKHRFKLAVGIAAVTAFMMFVGSGFLASLFRPHPGRRTGKKGADGF